MRSKHKSISRLITGIQCILIFLIVSQVTSCKKYLDKKSNNSYVVPTTINDLQGLLDDANTMNQSLTPSYGQGSTDDYFLLQSTYDGRPTFQQSAYTWIPADYFWDNDWSKCYSAVYNSNYCLEQILSIPLTSQNESKWKNVKGSALFYRAYNFLMLAWNYAKAYDESTYNVDLGIPLRFGSDFNVLSVRASVKETYEKIISDAKESIQYLPNIPTHTFRPSISASYGLLARTYLSMRKYDSAFKYSNLCLQIKNQLIDLNGDPDFLGASAAVPFKQFNKETIFYTEMNLLIGIISTGRAKIDTSLYASYSTDDLRKTAFFQPTNGYFSFKGSYGPSGIYFSGIATDEMYLTRAECFARGVNGNPGDKGAALIDLNILLAKRIKTAFWVPETANSAQEALIKVLIERRKELLFRGLRWIDIKRLNKEGMNIVLTRIISSKIYTLQPSTNYYALPLPTDIINTSGMQQNPY